MFVTRREPSFKRRGCVFSNATDVTPRKCAALSDMRHSDIPSLTSTSSNSNYCSKECQREGWKTHKPICVKVGQGRKKARYWSKDYMFWIQLRKDVILTYFAWAMKLNEDINNFKTRFLMCKVVFQPLEPLVRHKYRVTTIQSFDFETWKRRLGDQCFNDIYRDVARHDELARKQGHRGSGAVIFLNDTGGQGLLPIHMPMGVPQGSFAKELSADVAELIMREMND